MRSLTLKSCLLTGLLMGSLWLPSVACLPSVAWAQESHWDTPPKHPKLNINPGPAPTRTPRPERPTGPKETPKQKRERLLDTLKDSTGRRFSR